jgi:hypothetical protein
MGRFTRIVALGVGVPTIIGKFGRRTVEWMMATLARKEPL